VTAPGRLRQRDAKALQRRLADARQAVEDLSMAWGVWADDVRQEAEHRHGADADAEILWADPEYSRALDGGEPIRQAKDAVLNAEAWFTRAEAATAAAQTPEPEAEL
jgi:hypothetical protein